MRYLRGTSNLKLTFGSGKPVLVGYTNSDMARDVDNRKSTSGYLITFSGGVVSWQSRLQKCVALSVRKLLERINKTKITTYYRNLGKHKPNVWTFQAS